MMKNNMKRTKLYVIACCTVIMMLCMTPFQYTQAQDGNVDDDFGEYQVSQDDVICVEPTLYQYYFQQDAFHKDMNVYCKFWQEQIDENMEEESIQKLKIADFDYDGRVEVWIGISNEKALILDILSDSVRQIYVYGTEVGMYYDSETGERGLVTRESEWQQELTEYSRLNIYDADWHSTQLCSKIENGKFSTHYSKYYDANDQSITKEAYDKIYSDIEEKCMETDTIYECEVADMSAEEVLDELYHAEQGEE